jgi:hypothetical protein
MLTQNNLITNIYFLEDAKYDAILSSAFYNCSNLESIYNLPNTITKIENLAFQGCKKLKLDNLPSSLSTIGVGAFGFNDELELTTLPANLTKIGASAFTSCEKLLISEFGT